jgi:hypothetical protein
MMHQQAAIDTLKAMLEDETIEYEEEGRLKLR